MATGVRLPRIDLAQVLQAQHPSIDLRLQVYEDSTNNFIKALVNYKNRAIATISERRKYQATEKKKLGEKIQHIEAETNQCKLKEIDLVADLEREKEERKDAELTVSALRRQLASLKEKSAAIQAEMEQYMTLSANLRREKDKERATLSTHASHISPELIVCEEKLACIIEGVGKDQLLVRFNRIDPNDPAREASFVLEIGESSYRVLTVSPNLPNLGLPISHLTEGGDIYRFIREIRQVFARASTHDDAGVLHP